VARKVRESHPELPVIYISGDSHKMWSVYGVPNSVMLAKPFAIAQLTLAPAAMLNQQTAG
jgi:DNA-binding response OmpR family regulator